jgi:hypothetical protein
MALMSLLWVQGQGMRAAEMLIWLGDFNYRVNCSYQEAKDYIQQGWIKELLAKVSFPTHSPPIHLIFM